MLTCPFCPFFETRVLAGGATTSAAQACFVNCKSSECGRVSCSLCKKECVPCDDDEEEDEAVRMGMDEHFVCAELEADLGTLKKAWEEAIEAGITRPCPSCGHRGVKDSACTHMTCNCMTVWCYVCGLDCDSDQCSKAPGDGRACYKHNVNWFTNTDRCPMYLNEIHEVDESWPEDGEDAKEHLHRILILRNLKREYDQMGPAAYARMTAAFPKTGPACGYTEDEIKSVDLEAPLFQRNGDFEEEEEEESEEEEDSEE